MANQIFRQLPDAMSAMMLANASKKTPAKKTKAKAKPKAKSKSKAPVFSSQNKVKK